MLKKSSCVIEITVEYFFGKIMHLFALPQGVCSSSSLGEMGNIYHFLVSNFLRMFQDVHQNYKNWTVFFVELLKNRIKCRRFRNTKPIV